MLVKLSLVTVLPARAVLTAFLMVGVRALMILVTRPLSLLLVTCCCLVTALTGVTTCLTGATN